MTPKKILVTGGAGLIGSHLCERLLDEGNDVICIDQAVHSRSSVSRMSSRPNMRIVQHCVTKPLDTDVSQIYHLAGPGASTFYESHPVERLESIVKGNFNIMESARRHNATLLCASTGSLDHDMCQTTDNAYRIAEQMAAAYYDQHRLNVKIARIYNTYGPRMDLDDRRAVPSFIAAALTGRDITIYGGGEQMRSFCYVDDMVSALIRLMNNTSPSMAIPVSIGGMERISIKALAEMIVGMTGSHSRIVSLGARSDHGAHKIADITAARRTLAWEPLVGLKEGLEKTIDYIDRELRSERRARQERILSWTEMA